MIITRTPFRVSFVGGGSDLRKFYSKNGYGAVISSAIRKYMYIIIHPYFHNKVRIKYSRTEDIEHIDEIQHPIVRECLRKVNAERGLEIASFADVPSGTGLGSSSSFTVGLLNALHAWQGKVMSPEVLAKEACEIEIDILGEPIGKQDQYAAAYGDLNYIRFDSDESVFLDPIICKPGIRAVLEKNLLMFYVGNERKSSHVLDEQKENMGHTEKYEAVRKMVNLSESLGESLTMGNVENFGEILHEGWLLKKELASNISNALINGYYEKALKAGAEGGKLLGAGAGGFLLFYCRPKYQNEVRKALNLRELKLSFDREGSRIIYWDKQSKGSEL